MRTKTKTRRGTVQGTREGTTVGWTVAPEPGCGARLCGRDYHWWFFGASVHGDPDRQHVRVYATKADALAAGRQHGAERPVAHRVVRR